MSNAKLIITVYTVLFQYKHFPSIIFWNLYHFKTLYETYTYNFSYLTLFNITFFIHIISYNYLWTQTNFLKRYLPNLCRSSFQDQQCYNRPSRQSNFPFNLHLPLNATKACLQSSDNSPPISYFIRKLIE